MIFFLLGIFLMSGCETLATQTPGVFVPNLRGNYTLSNTNVDVCATQLDANVSVDQDEENFIIHANTPGFSDFTGTVDEAGLIQAIGASSFANTLECTGQATGDFLTGICETDIETCVTDAVTQDRTCTTSTVTCAFSYEKD
jgi:hypothetical protein